MPTKPDPFNIESLDPTLLLHEPPEPFSLLAPGYEIAAGDIKRLGHEDRWEEALEDEVGHQVPVRGIAYARVCPPEMFQPAGEQDIIEPNYLMWTDSAPEWLRVPAVIVGQTVREMMLAGLAENTRRFFAKPDPATAGHTVLVEVPPRHRALWPGEATRRGDKVVYKDLTAWETISETMPEGFRVPVADEVNDFARYCRPVSPGFQSWYVSAERGKEGALGGYEDPFVSLEEAQARIEAAGEKAGVKPNGMIFDLEGKPLMAYDIPAPPLEEVVRHEEAYTLGKPDEEDPGKSGQAEACHAAYLPGSIEDMAKHQDLVTSAVLEAARSSVPAKYRIMEIGEEARDGDLWYGPMAGDPDVVMWQPCPAELINQEPGDYLFARKRAPARLMQPLLVARLESVISDAEEMLDELKSIRDEVLRYEGAPQH